MNANFLINDPTDLIYEAHLYFDDDFSGKYMAQTSRNIDPMIGVERARPFIEWLQKHGQKGFLGEYGIPDDLPEAAQAMDNLLAYLNDNCVPSAYWAGGPAGAPTSCDRAAQRQRPSADGAHAQAPGQRLHGHRPYTCANC